jgi:UDP-glucose 4-epimerase
MKHTDKRILVTGADGFTPQYSLEQSLQQCIDWFTRPENPTRYKIDIYNV